MNGVEAAELGLQVKQVEGLVPPQSHMVASLEGLELHPQWTVLARLPMLVTAAVPLPRFKVRDLLGLRIGQTLESAWASTADVPLTLGNTRLSWAEFDAVEQRLAVRLTRLA